jgi:uncharacterized protein
MLELRPTCEHCNRALPPESTDAMICSFECTFCRDCVQLLEDVCPNCGGGFAPRPVRPAHDWKGDHTVARFPPSSHVVYKPVDLAVHAVLVARVNGVESAQR